MRDVQRHLGLTYGIATEASRGLGRRRSYAGRPGREGDRRTSPSSQPPRARDFFIQPEQQKFTEVDHSPTVRDGEHEVEGTEWGGRGACSCRLVRSKHTK